MRSLARGLPDRSAAALAEVLDDGPLADSDFRLRGDVRLLRAAAGRRPIVRLEHPRLDVIKNQGALFLIEGKQLILDGIDPAIADLQDLPREHAGGSS